MANQYVDYLTDAELRQQESLIRNGEARIPICFCIDTSYSMGFLMNPDSDFRILSRGQNRDGIDSVQTVELLPGKVAMRVIDEVKKVLRSILMRMQQIPEILNSASVCIITFDEFTDRITGGFAPIKDIDPDTVVKKIVHKAEETNAVAGLEESIRELENYKLLNSQAENDAYNPVLIFISDGSPTNLVYEYERIGRQIRKKADSNLIKVIPIGIGNNVNRKWMSSLAKDNQLFSMSSNDEFDKVFDMIQQRIYYSVQRMAADSNEESNEIIQKRNLEQVKELSSAVGDDAASNENMYRELVAGNFIRG